MDQIAGRDGEILDSRRNLSSYEFLMSLDWLCLRQSPSYEPLEAGCETWNIREGSEMNGDGNKKMVRLIYNATSSILSASPSIAFAMSTLYYTSQLDGVNKTGKREMIVPLNSRWFTLPL